MMLAGLGTPIGELPDTEPTDSACYLQILLGMLFHTTAEAGAPSRDEAADGLLRGGYWTPDETQWLLAWMDSHGLVV